MLDLLFVYNCRMQSIDKSRLYSIEKCTNLIDYLLNHLNMQKQLSTFLPVFYKYLRSLNF